MWVRSQDRKKLTEIHDLDIDDNELIGEILAKCEVVG